MNTDDIAGIGVGDGDNGYYRSQYFTEIEPNKSIKVTIRHAVIDDNSSQKKTAIVPPYRLEFTIAMATDINNSRGEMVNGKKRGVLIDVETDK